MLNQCSIPDVRRAKTPMENRTTTAATPPASRPHLADLPAAQRSRRSNSPFADIKTNTAAGRRIADLVRAYLTALGNPTSIEHQAEVIAAAELTVLSEEARTVALRDAGRADLDQVIRLQGAADRAVRRLGIKPGKPAAPVESFADIAARAQAASTARRALELAADEDDDGAAP
jgi:hypothetical protein